MLIRNVFAAFIIAIFIVPMSSAPSFSQTTAELRQQLQSLRQQIRDARAVMATQAGLRQQAISDLNDNDPTNDATAQTNLTNALDAFLVARNSRDLLLTTFFSTKTQLTDQLAMNNPISPN